MSTYTVEMSLSEIENLKKKLIPTTEKKTPPHALWQIQVDRCTITAYKSGKVVFQGTQCDCFLNVKIDNTTSNDQIFPQCGSDEVGTGDYFGPVCVCACYISKEDLDLIESFKIQDSKHLNDSYIREIAPILIKQLQHSLLILDNKKYNEIYPCNNLNSIKAKLHNKCYEHLQKKLKQLPKFCVIDQFVASTSYYRYLKNEETIIRHLHFETKAENKYLSVACASIIARYAFLKHMDKMSEIYQFSFLKGASSKVDKQIQEFVTLFGKEKLSHVAKIHFQNTVKAGFHDIK